ncbi:hypothetical protein ACFQX8_26675 [Klenkia terrae]|uniref:hypothetical protein n=1 Tax=Klenkia terrae TaxID=1052259 RepID=UPI00361551F8
MQLLAACQRVPSVRRLVLKSTSAVYGASPATPPSSPRRCRPVGCPAAASPRTAWTSRATSGPSPAGAPRSGWPCCGSPTSSARGSTRC